MRIYRLMRVIAPTKVVTVKVVSLLGCYLILRQNQITVQRERLMLPGI